MVGDQGEQLLGAPGERALGERLDARRELVLPVTEPLGDTEGQGVLLPGIQATVSEQEPRSSSSSTWWEAPSSLIWRVAPASWRSSTARAGSGSRPRAQARSAARVSE